MWNVSANSGICKMCVEQPGKCLIYSKMEEGL